MEERRRKAGVGFWCAALLAAAMIVYPLSFGPACWWFADSVAEGSIVYNVLNFAPHPYWPIGWLAENGPEPVSGAIHWYGTLGIEWVHVPTNRTATTWIVLVKAK